MLPLGLIKSLIRNERQGRVELNKMVMEYSVYWAERRLFIAKKAVSVSLNNKATKLSIFIKIFGTFPPTITFYFIYFVKFCNRKSDQLLNSIMNIIKTMVCLSRNPQFFLKKKTDFSECRYFLK